MAKVKRIVALLTVAGVMTSMAAMPAYAHGSLADVDVSIKDKNTCVNAVIAQCK